jgi:hypothetical protein
MSVSSPLTSQLGRAMFGLAGDPYLYVLIVGAPSAVGILARQWRLRMRDRDDYRLRKHVFDHTLNFVVLTDLPAMRLAERPVMPSRGQDPR